MNKIYVDIDFENKTLTKAGVDLITGDYASTEIEFTFDEKHNAGRKVFEMKSPSGQLVMVEQIINNKILLTAKDENENNVSLFSESGYYIFEISYYENNSKLTSIYGEIPVEQEQVVVDGEVMTPYLPIFDQLMQQINTAITETNNLNIDGSKTGKITTITITYKDGTTKELQLEDGKSIEYNWQGTQLGIRQEGQSEYVYVDLKGDKGDAGAIKMLIVAELPETGQDDTIYLVPLETSDVQGNNYAEYVYINNAWELLGKIGVHVDLTDYVKNTDYATKTKGGVIRVSDYYDLMITNDGRIYANNLAYSTYAGEPNGAFIGKGTLENVITGKGLVSNTDYAGDGTSGVIKAGSYYATEVNTGGSLRCQTKSYSDYSDASNYMFISKGTLNNVLNARIGDINSVLDAINGEVI